MLYSVTFFPKNSTVEVEEGTTLLDSAVKAGVSINAVCGGEGKCGRCRVIVEGAVDSPDTSLINPLDWENGYRLACQSKVRSDLIVFVPHEAQVGEHKILTTFHVAELSDLSPLVSWKYLDLPRPTLDDNLGDLERIERSLGLAHGELDAQLKVLRKLPDVIRSSDWNVSVVLEGEHNLIDIRPGECLRELGLAVDVGTTTVVAALIDMRNGEVLSQASDYNKQIVCGEDVLSRIAFCEDRSVERPQRLVLDTINALISKIQVDIKAREECNLTGDDISSISVAGNTTMIHLLLGLDPRGIRYDPYVPLTNLPPILRAGDVGIEILPQAPVYFVPGRASYVGGDIIADVLASELHTSLETSLLIDVGTNGEIVLGNRDWMVACSCSAGPAFEGGEVAHGMRAMMGAIDSIQLKQGEIEYTTIGGGKPIGICGSGLIDLIAEMFKNRVVDKKGRIQDLNNPRVRMGDEGSEFVVAWAEETAVDGGSPDCPDGRRGDIIITDNDIQNIIRTKAAVYAAASVLLKSVDLAFEDLSQVFVAGGFGNYLDIGKATVIGLLPDLPEDKFVFLGNGALAGARLTLLSETKRREASMVHERMTYFELSTTQAFFDEFSSSLFLPHTDISKFPNVRKMLETSG
ncbi:MAG: DUF4445 domain-containing protein [Methanomassiliicoccales archaeon]|nr:DUF4445 domain-containing protein [Methanomassiliicoccales archaeon]